MKQLFVHPNVEVELLHGRQLTDGYNSLEESPLEEQIDAVLVFLFTGISWRVLEGIGHRLGKQLDIDGDDVYDALSDVTAEAYDEQC